jgi:hypothetical protein
MLIEVEVTAGNNSPLDLHRMFDLLEDPRPVSRVLAPDPLGNDVWCEVTGWDSGGPCQAMAALSEDSGEGVVLLIYGGDEGLRLRPSGACGDWDLAVDGQWGEACLMLGKDASIE